MTRISWLLIICVFCGFLSGCSTNDGISSGLMESSNEIAHAPREYAEVNFTVRVPATQAEPGPIYLQMLDEVTGLLLNPITYRLSEQSANVYTANIAVPLNSLIKYRYTYGENSTNIEFTPMGQAVRYRLALIDQPMTIEDTISTWGIDGFTGNYGRIEGHVVDANGTPMMNSMVSIAGSLTLTSSDGSFLIDGIPVGTHNLVVYSMDGKHDVFQQSALVATDLNTAVEVVVQPSTLVKITFHLTVPDDIFAQLPVRVIGNTYSTGNTFADLAGGINAPANRAPFMSSEGEHSFVYSLLLPVGSDFRYKYTHGDGFWNAEQSAESRFVVRQLIVPNQDTDIYDSVESWDISDKSPISIIASIPENTPEDALVSIQFRPNDWMTPIPMWKIDKSRWLFVLTAPLEYFSDINYRYCLNDDCDLSPEVNLDGLLIQRSLLINADPQNIEDQIMGWHWGAADSTSTADDIFYASVREAGDLAGIALNVKYNVTNQAYLGSLIDSVGGIGANVLVLSPEWQFTRINLPVLDAIPGLTMFDQELQQTVSVAKGNGISVAVYPQTSLGRFENVFWSTANQDYGWWNSWFQRYTRFLTHYAELSENNGVSVLILGEEGMRKSFFQSEGANTLLRDEPKFASYWPDLVSDLRSHYSGKIYWAIPFTGAGELGSLPEGILDAVDGVYVLWETDLSSEAGSASLETIAPKMMEQLSLLQTYEDQGLDVVICYQYPAADEGIKGILNVNGNNKPLEDITDYSGYTVNLTTQTVLYQAMLQAIDSQPWIDGFISGGYYPGIGVEDASASVRGKPAEDLLSIFYHAWHGN